MWRDGVISSFQCPTKIVFGIGAHEALADVVRERAVKRLLVLLEPALLNSAIHRKVAGILAQKDVATIVLSVSDSIMQAALESRRQQGADGLLVIGGDSTIEAAKAVGSLMP